MKSWLSRAVFALAAVALLPACDGTPMSVFYGPPNVDAKGVLRGSQLVPAISNGASGTATLTVNGNKHFIEYTIDATALSGAATAVELRLGVAGTNGPVLFTFPLGAFPLTGQFKDTSFFQPVGNVLTFADACDNIVAGNTYLLISTALQATGEIRAQLGSVILSSAILSGSQEIPAVSSTGTGSAKITTNAAQDELTVVVNHSGLVSIIGAQIFDGPPGTAGTTALFDLATASFPTGLTVTLKTGDFTASAGAATFPDMINLLMSGGLHIQIQTTAHSTGELRGQLGPVQMNAILTAADVSPPNSSTATGQGTFVLDAAQTTLLVLMTHNVPSANAVTMHADDPTFNGPQIFDIDAIAGAPASPINTTLKPTQLIVAPSKGITSFPTFIDSFLRGKTYVDVGSSGFPAGEIRGQILP